MKFEVRRKEKRWELEERKVWWKHSRQGNHYEQKHKRRVQVDIVFMGNGKYISLAKSESLYKQIIK